MKIPFLPYHIVSSRFIKENENSVKVMSKQVAKLVGERHDLIEHIMTLPKKYWPRQ